MKRQRTPSITSSSNEDTESLWGAQKLLLEPKGRSGNALRLFPIFLSFSVGEADVGTSTRAEIFVQHPCTSCECISLKGGTKRLVSRQGRRF